MSRGCSTAMGGASSAPVPGIPGPTQRPKSGSKKLPRLLETELRQAPAGMPVRLLFQDEARFGRLSDQRRCWAPLCRAAPHMTGQLVDAMLDPSQDFAIRRRIPKVLSVTASQRAADGLLLGLADKRFEVRFQCGCALASIRDRNPEIHIDPEPVFAAVQREVTVGKKVWGTHRLLDPEEGLADSPFIDDFLRDRANRSLEHVFTILSLVLPKEPLQIAFRGLHTTDEHLRGTALEYLESILPPPIRERLWPFLEDRRKKTRETRSREEILATLLRSHQSIELNLTELSKEFENSRKSSGIT